MENALNTWNTQFPDSPMTLADWKVPHKIMGALLEVCDTLGIDRDIVLMPPPESERDGHTIYYWDLLPVINMVRVINHITVLPCLTQPFININYILQPTTSLSQYMFMVLCNLIIFNDSTLKSIAEYEEELFACKDQMKVLEDKKNKLLEILNDQANKKGKRAERLEKLDFDIKQYEEELRNEKELHDKVKQELTTVDKEWQHIKMLIEQKTSQRDGILAEIANKKALRVYDADDVRAQVEKARKNVQESEEKLNTFGETLMQKEMSLKNLQTIKPSLDIANNLLSEIMKANEKLKGHDDNIDPDDNELESLQTELSELQAQLSEIMSMKANVAQKRLENQAKRQQPRIHMQSTLREMEENEKKNRDQAKKATQRTAELLELSNKYEEEKAQYMGELLNIKDSFISELTSMEEGLEKVVIDAEKRIVEKINARSKML